MQEDFAVPAYYHSIKFSVAGTEEIEQQSYINVTKKNLLKNDYPETDGPYDLHMGTTDRLMRCLTCGNNKENCPGHDGHIILRYPVQNPIFREEITKYLRVFCHSCGKIITSKVVSKHALKHKLLIEYGKITRSSSEKNPTCVHCKSVQPHIERDKAKSMIIWKIWYTAGIETKKTHMLNTEIAEIFDRISKESVETVGKSIESHPRKFILNSIKVPANSIRPDVKRGGNGTRTTVSDITTFTKTIVEINNSIPKTLPDPMTPDVELLIINLDLFYYEMVRGSTSTSQLRLNTNMSKTPDSISNRIPKKDGIIRKNLLGKRVWSMARAVITGDKNIKPYEVGVPIEIAKIMEIEEIVQEYNKDKLLKFFINRNNYPGCSKIEKQTNKGLRFFRVENMPINAKLEIGDKIYRHLIDGDYVCFNRQPSLLFCSISAHRVVVLNEGSTLRLNSATCNMYNADFDGDEMNLLPASSIGSRTEIKYTSSVGQWFIGYKSSKPRMGCFQDSLIGTAEITQNHVKMDRYHAIDMIAQVPENIYTATFPLDKKIYTGRDIISMILPKNTNYKGIANYYKKEWGKYSSLKYHPEEFNVVVERGVLKQGILDKAAVGQEASGGIFHIIHNEYGPTRVMDVIYGFQQITTKYFHYSGFTVGLEDISLPPNILKKVNKQISIVIKESEELTKQLHEGKLVSPIGMTLREYYEQQMIAKLEHGDEFIEPILNGIKSDRNGLYKLIFFGSKGKKDNILSILGAVGQQDIDGERLINQFSYGRSNIYYTRFDNSAEAGGYHSTSYTQGITQTAYISAAQEARNGLINIALSTSVAGEQSRKFIKSLESLCSNHHYNTIRNDKIIQPLYGETGLDPRRVEKVLFRSILISEKEFSDTYKVTIKQLDKEFRNKKMQQLLDDEFKELTDDRNYYRTCEFSMEAQNPNYLFTNHRYMPVNVRKILENIIYKYRDVKVRKKFNPVLAMEKINKLITNIGYRLTNEMQEKLNVEISPHIKYSVVLFQILLKSELCISQLIKSKLWNEPIDEVIDKIKLDFDNAIITPGTAMGIIAAQSLSEPLTQFVLDSKHRSGAKGKKINVITRIKEIAGGKSTEKMKTPTMILHVKSEYQEDKQKVQEIANHIEIMPLRRFVTEEYIWYDEYGKTVHPNFLKENEKIKDFDKYNFGSSKPNDLTKWNILFRLNSEELILKNMKIETIVHKIQDKFPSLYLVYSIQASDQLYIRCYLRSNTWKKMIEFNINKVKDLKNSIINMIIRGVNNITGAEVTTVVKSYIDKANAINTKKSYVIITEGTNLSKCLENSFLDRYNLHSDSILENEEIYGIDMARQKIFSELKNVTEQSAVDAHYSLIADEMTSTGSVTPLERIGLDQREPNNVLLRASFHGPVQVLTKAAIHNKCEIIRNSSSRLLMGDIANIGTDYSDILFDEKCMQNNKVTAKDIISSLI